MSGKLLLIADDVHGRKLREHGEFPESWLSILDGSTALFRRLQTDAPWVACCRRSLLLPEGDRFEGEKREAQLELLHNLPGATLCYLAVVDRYSDDASEAALESIGLAPHLQWWEKFGAVLSEQVRVGHSPLRRVLILVLTEPPPADELPHFKRLTFGGAANRPFDSCYVMFDRMAPSQNGPRFLQAKHVWPIAVSGLLLKLLHDPVSAPASGGDLLAWRWYPLAPDLERTQWERFRAEQFGSLLRLLIEDESSKKEDCSFPTAVAESPIAGPSVSDISHEQQDSKVYSWLNEPFRDRLARAERQPHLEQLLQRAGEHWAAGASSQTLQEVPAESEVRRFWAAVRQNPRLAFCEDESARTGSGEALKDQFAAMNQRWGDVRKAERDRAEVVERAEQCANHVVAAQDGFVSWRLRAITAGVAAAIVGYLALLLFTSLFGWFWAAVAALAGAAGAIFGAMATLDGERRSGRRAQAAMHSLLRDMEELGRNRHLRRQKAVEAAHRFGRQIQSEAVVDRARRLLRRLRTILDHEFRHRDGPEADLDDADEFSEEGVALDVAPIAERGRRQRMLLRQTIELRNPIGVEDYMLGRDAEVFEQFVSRQRKAFLEEVWTPLCERHDPRLAGNLPARAVIPALRDFRDRFLASLSAQVRAMAVEKLSDADLGPWAEQVRQVVDYQRFLELLSCPLDSHQTSDDRAPARLYLRKEFQASALMQDLRSSKVAATPETSAWLGDSPWIGFLYQETPLQVQSSGGQVKPAPYRKKRPPKPK